MHVTAAQLVMLRPRARRNRSYTRTARMNRAPEQPRAIELGYTRDLLALLRPVHEAIRRELYPALGEIASRQDVLYGRIANRFAVVVADARELFKPEKITPVIDSTAVRLDKFNKVQVAKQLGISFARDTHVQAMRATFRDTNVRLIQSIPEQLLGQVDDVLGQAAGLRVEEIQDRLEERFSVSESRAALIARDQVLKGNADLNQARQQDVGITAYAWSTVADERVRPFHRALDGQRIEWVSPPIVSTDGRHEHAGKDYQCRCFPDPVIPD